MVFNTRILSRLMRVSLPVLLLVVGVWMLFGLKGVKMLSGDDGRAEPPPLVSMTMPKSEPGSKPLQFIVFGDNGSGLAGQKRLAAEMVRQYEKSPFLFALMLGDNIYPDGDVAQYGYDRFTKPYQPLLEKGVRFFSTLGNHDIAGGHEKEVLAFFKMPGPYYEFAAGDIRFFVLNTNAFDKKQQQWLASALGNAKEPWKIVYGHHPVYSSGMHGSSTALIRDLKPLLEIYHADFYFAGHDHNYERFTPKNGVRYIVSGGGGASLRGFQKPVPGSVVRASTYHFIRFTQEGNRLTFDVVDAEGKRIDAGVVTKADQEKLKPAA